MYSKRHYRKKRPRYIREGRIPRRIRKRDEISDRNFFRELDALHGMLAARFNTTKENVATAWRLALNKQEMELIDGTGEPFMTGILKDNSITITNLSIGDESK